jgi:hypothetical protein
MINAIQHLNYLSVLLASVAYFALGALWYSKILFASQWMEMTKVDSNDRSGMARAMITGFLYTLLIVFVTGVMIHLSRCHQFIDCIQVGILLGVGYSVGILGMTYGYGKKPLMLLAIDAGYHIVGITLATAILAKM